MRFAAVAALAVALSVAMLLPTNQEVDAQDSQECERKETGSGQGSITFHYDCKHDFLDCQGHSTVQKDFGFRDQGKCEPRQLF